MGLFDKAKDLAAEHSEQVGQGVDKGGDMLDEKTGGKYADKVDQGQEFAKGHLGGGDEPAADAPQQDAPQQ